MSVSPQASVNGDSARNREVIISADSHTMEPPDLWVTRLPATFRDQAPRFPEHKVGVGFQHHPGGHDPHARIKEMSTDGVSAEVLYPTLGLNLYSQTDAALQEACFRVYNDWLIEYCQVAPDRLVGIPMISTYNIQNAVAELERCTKAGLKGALVWQAPHPDLPFSSDHYDRLWAAAQDLEAPVSLHILTGHSYFSAPGGRPIGNEHYRGSVNLKLLDVANAVFDLIFYGAVERFPRLQLVVVEAEVGWVPWILQQWDYYWKRFYDQNKPPIDKPPSFYFNRQIYVTFFNDNVGCKSFSWWGQDNCMWSNDFPHPNSTWPNSHAVIQRDLGHLPDDVRAKLVRDNVSRLYGMPVPEPVAVSS